MQKLLFSLALLSLAGCASLTGDNNKDTREVTRITCSGASSWEVCAKKSLSVCPNGYDIFNKEENLITGLRAYEIACKH